MTAPRTSGGLTADTAAKRGGRCGPGPRRRPRGQTLLLLDPDDPQQLTARSNRRWGRLVARLLAPSLDRQLAQGRSSESSRLLAVRAHLLVSPAVRHALARNWEDLLVRARTPPVPRDPRVPINRHSIVASEPEIREIGHALLAPLPVAARGVAMASRLLSDGRGPLYDRRRSADVSSAVRSVIAELDPSVSLITGTRWA